MIKGMIVDGIFNKLCDLAQNDKNIMLLTADMGGISLDKFRNKFPQQFIDCGIAEQNMICVAAGLVLSSKKVFVYAIAPFVTGRCYEAIKVNFHYMNLPLTILSIGTGQSYWEAGPTHHATDDIVLMQTIGANVLTPKNVEEAEKFIELAYNSEGITYIRFPRVGINTLVNKRVLYKP